MAGSSEKDVSKKRKPKSGEDEPRKRKRGNEDDAGDGPSTSGTGRPTIGQQTANVRNKLVRSELYAKLKNKQKKEKKAVRKKRQKAEEEALKQGLEPPPKKIPHTLENTREADVTTVDPEDDEVAAEQEQDEFAAHFNNDRPPKVLITTCYKPSKIMYTFLSEILEMLPAAEYYKRNGFPLKKIVKFASNRDYTDILVFNEDRKEINGLIHIHLPDGPTAMYRLSNLKLGKDIKGHGRATHHKPELILNNFTTRLGHRLGRMMASLFPQDPNFRGRRAVTFHNQRDYIFVRHHRYIFEEKEQRLTTKERQEAAAKGVKAPAKKKAVIARLQELGPRFTLKLQSLQKGTFDSKGGEFEWLSKKMEQKRTRFFL